MININAHERISSAMWAGATLLDAVIRVVMAHTLPVQAVPVMQTGLLVATTLLMQVVTNVSYLRAGLWTMVHQPYPRAAEQSEAGGRR